MTLGHGVWITQKDIEICAGTDTCIYQTCSSNFKLRCGVLPLMELLKCDIVMGMDEAGVNNDRDMLHEMSMLLKFHRVPGMDHETLPITTQVLHMMT